MDGKEYSAKLQHPLGIAWNHLEKQIYVADTYNHKIKSVDVTTGYCNTLFGDGKPDSSFSVGTPVSLETIKSQKLCGNIITVNISV